MTGASAPRRPREALPAVSPLVIATRNPAKLNEFRRILRTIPWQLRTLDDVGFTGELVEPGEGYAENASAKALAVSVATGLPALADDSGIEVLALRGWPGPRSARWMGPGADDRQRTLGLLEEVERSSPDDRRARYVCVLALARPEVEPVVSHGSCDGELTAPRGENGFGYDPAFLSSDLGITFGEASDEQKDRVSHRARAAARLSESGLLDWPMISL